MITEDPRHSWHPFSPSAAQNGEAICSALLPQLADNCRVFEIGSGTGQHAVRACLARPDLWWQPSERASELIALQANLERNPVPGVQTAMTFDALEPPATVPAFDALYTANTLHIMPPTAVESLFATLRNLMTPGQVFYSYGPFYFKDKPPVPSNLAFDASLRAANPDQGVRDLSWLVSLAAKSAVSLRATIEMPSNNTLLIWERLA